MVARSYGREQKIEEFHLLCLVLTRKMWSIQIVLRTTANLFYSVILSDYVHYVITRERALRVLP